jgi:hypothetical protein
MDAMIDRGDATQTYLSTELLGQYTTQQRVKKTGKAEAIQ